MFKARLSGLTILAAVTVLAGHAAASSQEYQGPNESRAEYEARMAAADARRREAELKETEARNQLERPKPEQAPKEKPEPPERQPHEPQVRERTDPSR